MSEIGPKPNMMEKEPEKDPLLGIKRLLNRWSRVAAREKGRLTRLNLIGDPEVLKKIGGSLNEGELNDLTEAAKQVLDVHIEETRSRVLGRMRRLGTPDEQLLTADTVYNKFREDRTLLDSEKLEDQVQVLENERIFDESMRLLMQQEEEKTD